MEYLKKIVEIVKPDVRQNCFVKIDVPGLITDRGFSDRVRKVKHIRENNAVLLPDFHLPEPKLMREYADTLVESIPFLRNQIAHGTNMLHEQGAKHVRICAELINQLFPSTPIN